MDGSTTDNTTSSLQTEYCPPIDSSLFAALLSDYDLADEENVRELRSVLDSLASNAPSEEEDGFDPSGTSGHAPASDDTSSRDEQTATTSDGFSSRNEREAESDTACTDLSGLQLNDGPDGTLTPDQIDWATASLDAKLAALQEMFPTLKPVTIRTVLKTQGDRHDRSIEELLNQAFLEDEQDENGEKVFKRGVDGFTMPGPKAKARKKRPRGRRSNVLSESVSDADSTPEKSIWDRAEEDAQWLARRTHIPHKVIKSVYYANGTSLSATVASLCNGQNEFLQDVPDDILDTQVVELMADSPFMNESQARQLIRLTHPSIEHARDLAQLLPPNTVSNVAIQPTYTAPPIATSTTSPNVTSSLSPSTLTTANTSDLTTLRTHALARASLAHRAAKSRPLMSAAAAHYNAEARLASAALRQRSTEQALARVVASSKPGELDLHGLSVSDAVTIAGQRVQEWWDSGAREYAREGKVLPGRELRVVTGKGAHSAGGKGKLGPAVGKRLVSEGWRVEVGSGWLDVVGRARRK